MKAEKILSKHTGKEGIYLTKGMVRGSDALEAMEEYKDAELKEAMELLKRHQAIRFLSGNDLIILEADIDNFLNKQDKEEG